MTQSQSNQSIKCIIYYTYVPVFIDLIEIMNLLAVIQMSVDCFMCSVNVNTPYGTWATKNLWENTVRKKSDEGMISDMFLWAASVNPAAINTSSTIIPLFSRRREEDLKCFVLKAWRLTNIHTLQFCVRLLLMHTLSCTHCSFTDRWRMPNIHYILTGWSPIMLNMLLGINLQSAAGCVNFTLRHSNGDGA